MSWQDGPLLGFDLETTGVDPLTCRPVSFALVEMVGVDVAGACHGLVKPGIPIPEGASAIHGISDADVAERGGELERTVLGITEKLVAADRAGVPVCGMNLRYDLTVIDSRLREITGDGLRLHGWQGIVVDVLVIDRHVDKYRKGSRKLTAIAEHYGVALEDAAHGALADAVASCRVAVAIADRYPEIGKQDVRQLSPLQTAWHREWAASFSQYRSGRGEAPLSEQEINCWPLPGDDSDWQDADQRLPGPFDEPF